MELVLFDLLVVPGSGPRADDSESSGESEDEESQTEDEEVPIPPDTAAPEPTAKTAAAAPEVTGTVAATVGGQGPPAPAPEKSKPADAAAGSADHKEKKTKDEEKKTEKVKKDKEKKKKDKKEKDKKEKKDEKEKTRGRSRSRRRRHHGDMAKDGRDGTDGGDAKIPKTQTRGSKGQNPLRSHQKGHGKGQVRWSNTNKPANIAGVGHWWQIRGRTPRVPPVPQENCSRWMGYVPALLQPASQQPGRNQSETRVAGSSSTADPRAGLWTSSICRHREERTQPISDSWASWPQSRRRVTVSRSRHDSAADASRPSKARRSRHGQPAGPVGGSHVDLTATGSSACTTGRVRAKRATSTATCGRTLWPCSIPVAHSDRAVTCSRIPHLASAFFGAEKWKDKS